VSPTIHHCCIPDDEGHLREIIGSFITGGADLTDKGGRTPLHRAVTRLGSDMDPTTFEYLIQRGAQVDVKDKEGNSVIRLAARYGRTKLVEVLLKHHASV